MNLPEKVYTETDVQRARSKGKAIGWLQGGGVVLGGALLWQFISWIPLAVGVTAVVWVLYKLFSRKSSEDAGENVDG